MGQQIVGAAVEGAGRDHVLAGLADIHDGQRRGALAGSAGQGPGAAFQHAHLALKGRDRGVAQAGVEVTEGLEVEKIGHILGAVVGKGGAQGQRYDARVAVARLIRALNGNGFRFPCFFCHCCFLCKILAVRFALQACSGGLPARLRPGCPPARPGMRA